MRLRQLLILLGFLGLGILIVTNLDDVHAFVTAISHIRWYVFPLVAILQFGGYYANGRYYQVFFATSDRHVDLRRLIEAAIGINFVNLALPAGGLAGTGYLAEVVRDTVPSGTATLAQLGRYAMTFLSYFVVLALGFVLLALSGDIDEPSVRIMLIVMVSVLGLGILFVPIVSDQSRLTKVVLPVVRFINGLFKRFFRRRSNLIPLVRVEQFLTDFSTDYEILSRDKRRRLQLLWWALLGNITEVATVYAVFIGFGLWPNLGVVITGYTLAVMASVLSLATGGLGVYEFGMIGAFAALGVPLAASFAVVIVYRGLSMIYFLPPGFYYYRKYLKSSP